MDLINNIFNNSGLLYDRYLGDNFTLPYTLNQIKVAENETNTSDLLNLKLSYLYENFLTLYKGTKIASNVIPISAVATAGVRSDTFSWTTGLSTSQFEKLDSAGLYNVDSTSVLSIQPNNALNQFSIFSSTGSDLVIFVSPNNETNITMILSAQEIYSQSNIFFQQIVSFAFDKSNNLFVLDLSANAVYKYNATGFLTNDNVFNNILQYTGTVGGFGTYLDNNRFNAPEGITFSDPYLYVLDSGNSCVKQYDNNFNWITTFRLFKDFLSAYPIDINVDSLSGNFWILCDNNTIHQYDPTFQNYNLIDISTIQSNNETFKKIVFSQQDPNIFYLVSDQNVYKKLVDKPQDTIGKYLLYLFNFNTPEKIGAFGSMSVGYGDNNLLFSASSGIGKFSLFFDNINLYSILATDSFTVYTLDDIKVDKEEYSQNWVFNKSLSKLLLNHLRLAKLFLGKFKGSRDASNNIVFDGARYLTLDELTTISFFYDITYFIGVNEILQNIIINRAFKKIYDLQVALQNILQSEIDASFNTSTVVFLG